MATLDLIDGYAALREGVAVCALPRDALVVEGVDAETYLQGQVSQDVSTLATGDRTWALVLQPQGKVDAWARIHRTAEDAFVVDVDAGCGDALGARLTRFLLRTKRRTLSVDLRDRLYAMDERHVVNRASMSKWGVRLGELSLFFEKA